MHILSAFHRLLKEKKEKDLQSSLFYYISFRPKSPRQGRAYDYKTLYLELGISFFSKHILYYTILYY